MKNLVLSAAILAIAVSAPLGAQSVNASETGKVHANAAARTKIKVSPSLAQTAKISADSAFAIARANASNGEVSSAELETHSGTLVYEVKVLNAKKRASTIRIDAMTGQVLSARHHGGVAGRQQHHEENKKLNAAKKDSAATRP